jgi:hypothetical protein
MRKLIAIAAAGVLAACGSSDEAEVDSNVPGGTEVGMQSPDAASPTSVAGTYFGTGEGGETWSSTINTDGTYEDRVGGELVETGTWTARGENTCFMQDSVEGDPVTEERCFTLGAPDAEGNVIFSNPEGEEMTVRKQVG